MVLQLTPPCVALQLFGLHANADISYYTSATKELLSNLVDLQPRTGAATGGISRDEFIAGVARDIAAKIPEPFDLPLLHKQLGAPTPTQVVLLQEVERWNGVLAAMSTSLKDLQKALAGELVEMLMLAGASMVNQSGGYVSTDDVWQSKATV